MTTVTRGTFKDGFPGVGAKPSTADPTCSGPAALGPENDARPEATTYRSSYRVIFVRVFETDRCTCICLPECRRGASCDASRHLYLECASYHRSLQGSTATKNLWVFP